MLETAVTMFVALLMLFLGGVIFAHAPRERVNRLFFAWVLLSVAWIAFNFMENVPAFSPYLREWFLRIDFSVASLGAGAIMLFVLCFTDRKTPTRRLIASYLPAVIAAGASLTPWLLQGVGFNSSNEINFIEGPLYFVYAPIILSYFVLSFIILMGAQAKAVSPLKEQMRSIAIGLALMTLVSASVNLFLQNVVSYVWLRIGIYSFVFFIFGVVWAIARHEFLRVKFVLVEILVLGILSTLLARLIVSRDVGDAIISGGTFVVLMFLGFATIRNYLKVESQKTELQVIAKQLELSNASLEQANAHLKEVDERKDEFISIASHQLRTPVAVMKGYISLIQEGAYGPVPDNMKDKIDNMMLMNERLVQMIDNMLNVTRIEKNRIEYTCSLVDVRPVLDQIVEQLQSKAATKGLSVSLGQVPNGPLVAYADYEKLIEILTNLVDNSIKYSAFGSIVISAATDSKRKCVVVAVTDHGYGMDQETTQRVFQKFYRSNTPEVMVQGGTGLGLYVCAMFVRGMGGDIWIEHSAPNEGTTIAFALPIEPGGQCKAPEEKMSPPVLPHQNDVPKK